MDIELAFTLCAVLGIVFGAAALGAWIGDLIEQRIRK